MLSARNGLVSVVALGLAYAGREIWKKRKGGKVGLRESYSQSSEWTPDAPPIQDTTPRAPSYG